MSKNSRKKIKVTYNAPVSLTFAVLCSAILLLSRFTKNGMISDFFASPGGSASSLPFDFSSPLHYLKLVIHIFCHADWQQLISNFSFILLLGPMIEEKYGSPIVIVMMTATSLVGGVLNACFGNTTLHGASDIAFMMILLASFSSFSKHEIPLSFILVLILYIGREISGIASGTQAETGISAVAHIAGGFCGSLFAFLASPKNAQARGKEIDEQSPRFKGKTPSKAEQDSTVVGTLEL